MANTIQNGAADLQKWQALQTQANTTQDVTKEQLLELKDQLRKDGFDVSSTSKLGQGFDNLQNVIDTTTFKTRSDTETNNIWTQASNEVTALLNDPTTNTADADNAGYQATSSALDADISKNKTLTAQLAADTAEGDKDGIASGITAISTNVQSQIQHINDGVANGSIDMTLGSRMVGYLNNADFALKQKAPDGTPAPNMDMWNSMTKFYGTSLTQLRAGDAGGAQTAAGTSGATAGTGTVGTGGASHAPATDPGATPGTVKLSAGATGTAPTIPPGSDLAKAAGVAPAPSITFSPVDHMFASVGTDGKVGVYGPDGKAITDSLEEGAVIKVTNPNKDAGQSAFVTIDKSGNFAAVNPSEKNRKIAEVITGESGNYAIKTRDSVDNFQATCAAVQSFIEHATQPTTAETDFAADSEALNKRLDTMFDAGAINKDQLASMKSSASAMLESAGQPEKGSAWNAAISALRTSLSQLDPQNTLPLDEAQ